MVHKEAKKTFGDFALFNHQSSSQANLRTTNSTASLIKRDKASKNENVYGIMNSSKGSIEEMQIRNTNVSSKNL